MSKKILLILINNNYNTVICVPSLQLFLFFENYDKLIKNTNKYLEYNFSINSGYSYINT